MYKTVQQIDEDFSSLAASYKSKFIVDQNTLSGTVGAKISALLKDFEIRVSGDRQKVETRASMSSATAYSLPGNKVKLRLTKP